LLFFVPQLAATIISEAVLDGFVSSVLLACLQVRARAPSKQASKKKTQNHDIATRSVAMSGF